MTAFWYPEAAATSGHTRRYLAGLAYLCAYAGRTSLRADHRADPTGVRSRQTGTVTEEANEKFRPASTKGPRSAESTRNSSPSTRFWVSYIPGMFQGGLRRGEMTPAAAPCMPQWVIDVGTTE